MHISISTFLVLISLSSTMASNCSRADQTYAHEWNKAAYYHCSRTCPYLKQCPPSQYYSARMSRCVSKPFDWSPQYKLSGRHQAVSSRSFLEIDAVQYKVNWRSEDDVAQYIFNGRYLNQTMFTGLEIILVKKSNCIRIQQSDFSVVADRHICRTRVALHWYSHTCELLFSQNVRCIAY
jgi:hypothetical protein